MRFIKITRQDKEGIVHVNSEHVTSINKVGDGSRLLLVNGAALYAKEPPNEILSKIEVIGGWDNK